MENRKEDENKSKNYNDDENLAIDFDNNDDYENLNLFQLKIL